MKYKDESKQEKSGVGFIEHNLEDENGTKFYIYLPNDATNITVINTVDTIRVGFKTKFGGNKYLQTYIEV